MLKGDGVMKVKTRNLIGFMAVIVVLIVILISIIKIYGIDISVSLAYGLSYRLHVATKGIQY